MGELQIAYICPFALLWSLCDVSVARPDTASVACPDAGYAGMLMGCFSQGQKDRAALYVDEITPGNALRPESQRSYYAFFWTLLDYPHWFRNTDLG